jgi:hypothetical protein
MRLRIRFIAKITLGVAEIACLAAMPEIGT